jgi:hypothetical protein
MRTMYIRNLLLHEWTGNNILAQQHPSNSNSPLSLSCKLFLIPPHHLYSQRIHPLSTYRDQLHFSSRPKIVAEIGIERSTDQYCIVFICYTVGDEIESGCYTRGDDEMGWLYWFKGGEVPVDESGKVFFGGRYCRRDRGNSLGDRAGVRSEWC